MSAYISIGIKCEKTIWRRWNRCICASCALVRVGYAQLINTFRRCSRRGNQKHVKYSWYSCITKQLLAPINPSIIGTTRFGLLFLLTCRPRNFSWNNASA